MASLSVYVIRSHERNTVQSTFTEFTETTTVDDSDGISKQRLMPMLPTFYTITLIDDNWIPAPTELNKNSSGDEIANVNFNLRSPPRKLPEFAEMTQNNVHYAVQGHSRSPILVQIESSYTISY